MIQDTYDMSQFLLPQLNQAENIIEVASVNSLEHVGWLPVYVGHGSFVYTTVRFWYILVCFCGYACVRVITMKRHI